MAYAASKKKKGGGKAISQHVDVAPVAEEEGDITHGTLVTWVNEADDATIGSRDLSEKCRAYYDTDGQWTADERAKLKKQKQAATVSNRIKPKMDGLMGMESANKTTAKAFPRTPKHEKGALAATESVRYCLQDNFYDQVRSAAWENLLIEGTAGIEVCVKADKKDENKFKIVIRHIMWDRLIYDPHSRSKSFGDNPRYKGQVVWMDYDEACSMYPDGEEVLEAMQEGSQTYDDKPRWMDNTRRRVKIVELYYRKADGHVWYCCFTRGGYLKQPQKSPYVNEEGETEDPYEFASLFVDREGGRYGSARQYLDVQDEINKRRSKALHLLSVRQTFGTAGSVADVNKARTELAKPDGHVEFAYGELNKDFGVLPTGDMAAGQFNLLAEAKQEIDAVGYNAAAAGKDMRAVSGVALRARSQAAQTELAPMFAVLKHLDIRVYRKVWNRIKQYWKAEMWIRVTDDEQNLKWVGLNKPITKGEQLLEQAKAQGAPPPALMQLQQQISADPSMGEIVDTQNDITDMDMDMVMDDAPDTVTQEVEDFQAMAEMVKSGFPLPPEAVIMSSPLGNKDKILKMMKEKPQIPPELQKQMEQMQEQMQKLQEEGQKLAQENQALKQDQQGEQAKLQLSAQEAQAKLQQRQAEAQAELILKAQTQAAELQLERERAQATIALERAKAEAQLELQGMKQKGDQENAMQKMEFEQKCRAEDQKAKTIEDNEAGATELAPKMVEAMRAIVEVLEGQRKIQEQLLENREKPKKVQISGIKRDGNDAITSADVSVH